MVTYQGLNSIQGLSHLVYKISFIKSLSSLRFRKQWKLVFLYSLLAVVIIDNSVCTGSIPGNSSVDSQKCVSGDRSVHSDITKLLTEVYTQRLQSLQALLQSGK